MSRRRQFAELIVVRASGFAADGQRRYPRWEATNADLRRWLGQEGIGGVILLGGSAADLALRCRQLQRWAPQPLLLCADVEEGVGQRFEGASWLVPPLALDGLWHREPARAAELARAYGRCTGHEARLLGLNWVLAPVCDVNNNPANPVINVRAWGQDPPAASALTAAFVEGLQAEGVLGCAKHFPGHGDTQDDSHLALPVLGHDRARLEAVELPPFRAAIAAGVASVMTAHLQLPALDAERPATLSAAVLSGLLRHELGFDGLVVTDALVMEAIAAHHGPGEAAALAFEAGADLLLMPGGVDAALAALERGDAEGRWPPERLERSLERRRRALASCRPAPATVEEALDGLLDPPSRDLADHLLDLSLQSRGAPRPWQGAGVNLLRIDNALSSAFLPLTAPALVEPQRAGLRTVLVDGQTQPLDPERLPEGPVLLQLFVRGNPFRGSAAAAAEWPQLVLELVTHDRLGGLAVYGSPYVWEALRDLVPPDRPAAYSPGQMPAAQARVLARLGLARGNGGPGDGFTD